jgi:hypothetical protein
VQKPHWDLDESNVSRQMRDNIVRRLHAIGIEFTKSLNLKVKDGDTVTGEASLNAACIRPRMNVFFFTFLVTL